MTIDLSRSLQLPKNRVALAAFARTLPDPPLGQRIFGGDARRAADDGRARVKEKVRLVSVLAGRETAGGPLYLPTTGAMALMAAGGPPESASPEADSSGPMPVVPAVEEKPIEEGQRGETEAYQEIRAKMAPAAHTASVKVRELIDKLGSFPSDSVNSETAQIVRQLEIVGALGRHLEELGIRVSITEQINRMERIIEVARANVQGAVALRRAPESLLLKAILALEDTEKALLCARLSAMHFIVKETGERMRRNVSDPATLATMEELNQVIRDRCGLKDFEIKTEGERDNAVRRFIEAAEDAAQRAMDAADQAREKAPLPVCCIQMPGHDGCCDAKRLKKKFFWCYRPGRLAKPAACPFYTGIAVIAGGAFAWGFAASATLGPVLVIAGVSYALIGGYFICTGRNDPEVKEAVTNVAGLLSSNIGEIVK